MSKKMKIKKISLDLEAEEIEAVNYVLELGIRAYKKGKLKPADDWVKIAERIRQILPTKIRVSGDKWEKSGSYLE